MDVVALVRKKLSGKTQGEIRAVATACGLNYFTFRKVVSGETKSPGYQMVERLREWLAAEMEQAPRGTAKVANDSKRRRKVAA